MSATPWFHPDPSPAPGKESPAPIVTSLDAVRADNVCQLQVNTHVKQRGAGCAGADEAITHTRVFSAVQASIACHSPHASARRPTDQQGQQRTHRHLTPPNRHKLLVATELLHARNIPRAPPTTQPCFDEYGRPVINPRYYPEANLTPATGFIRIQRRIQRYISMSCETP